MKKDGTNRLLEPLSIAGEGYSSVITNSGKIIAVITLIVASLVTFTDIALCDLTARSFTTSLIVMLISSYLMYFSMEDAGEREGEESEEFSTSYSRYLAIREQITPDRIENLRTFCLKYSKDELEYRRLCYLLENGLGACDLQDYREGKSFSAKQTRILRRADRMKAANLTPAILLSRNGGGGKSELTSPLRKKLFSGIMSLIPSTVCTIFTVSVALSAKDGLTAESCIEGILKLSALPIVGFRGMLDGYRYSRESKAAWLETKTGILESFMAE